MLAALWLGLPVQLPDTASELSTEACLTRADRPPLGTSDIPALLRCTTLVPDDVQLLTDLGNLYAEVGQANEAEAFYRRGIAVDPDVAALRLRLATLLLSRGRAREAREHAEHALRLQPNRRAALELIAQAARLEPR